MIEHAKTDLTTPVRVYTYLASFYTCACLHSDRYDKAACVVSFRSSFKEIDSHVSKFMPSILDDFVFVYFGRGTQFSKMSFRLGRPTLLECFVLINNVNTHTYLMT